MTGRGAPPGGTDRRGAGLVGGFLTHAQSRPDATALIWNDEHTSYGELHEQAVLAGDRLAQLDRTGGEPVGIVAVKSPAAVAMVLGCLLADVPFVLPNPTLGATALDELFDRAGCRYVLTPTGDAGGVSDGDAGTVFGSDLVADRPRPGPVTRADVGDATFLLTTSGSTGLPKIVPLPGGGIDRFVDTVGPLFGIGPGTTVLNLAPLNFDLCLLDIWTTLARGGQVVLADPSRIMRGAHLVELITRHQVEVVQSVPLFLGLLLDAAGGTAGATERPGPLTTPVVRAFGSVRHVLCTGDVLPERTATGLPRLFPAARLHNVYGCTETNDSFVHELSFADIAGGPPPIGRPLPGVEALVLDASGAPVHGPGAGELWVHTPFQSGGYLARPDRGGFGPDPLGRDGRTWFRTGDLVRRDQDGALHLQGRTDFQVKIRGVAVNTAEIERILLLHPNVAEAAVGAVEDPSAGRVLVATVRRGPGSGLNSLALRQHCAQRLPRAAVPTTLHVVDHPLPRTSTGKVDRAAAVSVTAPTERRVS